MAANGIDAAIRELERDLDRIQEAIRILKSVSNKGGGSAAGRPGRPRGGRRKLSAAGRKRIAEAAKKRWAAFRASQKA
jgi:hypothetical protein